MMKKKKKKKRTTRIAMRQDSSIGGAEDAYVEEESASKYTEDSYEREEPWYPEVVPSRRPVGQGSLHRKGNRCSLWLWAKVMHGARMEERKAMLKEAAKERGRATGRQTFGRRYPCGNLGHSQTWYPKKEGSSDGQRTGKGWGRATPWLTM